MNKSIVKELVNRYIDEIDARNYENIVYDALAKNVFDDLLYLFDNAGISIPVGITKLPHDYSVDVSSMPAYLRDAHFVAWFQKFNQLLCQIGLPNWNIYRMEINVEFSNEKKMERYGTLTIAELKEIIRDIWGIHEEIEDILGRIRSYEDYRRLIQELMEAINRIFQERNCHNPEYLYSLLDELIFDIPVLGEYINSKKLIVLYVPNIEEAADKHGNIPSREFEKVFIHELFHAYHYVNGKDEIYFRYDYTSKAVKESLASAFEWVYCVETQIDGVDSLRSSWSYHSILFFPYSGASWLLSEVGTFTGRYVLNNNLFRRVFDKSLTDMDNALRELLDIDIFYLIKNSYQIRKPVVKKRVLLTDLRKAFDELMKKDDVGIVAHREITSIIRQNKNRHLVRDLLDQAYCNKTFGITGYPVLATAPMFDVTGRPRSYSDPVLRIGNTNYYLCSQWSKRHFDPLLDWIWANR